MTNAPLRDIRRCDWSVHPLDMLDAWPADQPLVMLHSGRLHERWARWSILACPQAVLTIDESLRWRGKPPSTLPTQNQTGDPLTDLQEILNATSLSRSACDVQNDLPFTAGWIGSFAYDLGRIIEPRATHEPGSRDDHHWPLIELAWCPHALVYDHLHNQWYESGRASAPSWFNEQSVNNLHESEQGTSQREASQRAFEVGTIANHMPPDAYLHMVQRTQAYIADGDIFQANITQRLEAPFDGSTRALARQAFETSGAWYGAYLEFPNGRTLLSLSPELLLKVDDESSTNDVSLRRVVTRPIKGTRPGHVDAQQLEDSPKDAAELNMIIDLMRNDLGRVCEFGSVRVPFGRIIESHPTIHHGVGEVHGTLRKNITATDLLRAVFPGGSVTGAPKIRAMQIINELEPVRRGPYCGSIGLIGTDGRMQLNVAIRTIALHGKRPANRFDALNGTLDYGTGGGIVADSDPVLELRECHDKAAVLRMVTDRSRTTQSR